MKKIDKVLNNKEKLTEMLINEYCPNDFGLKDCRECDRKYCRKCWEQESEG